MNPTPANHAPCFECGRRLPGVGPGVHCPTCGAVNYAFPDGSSLRHQSSNLFPLDPAARLIEHLGTLGLSAEVETERLLCVPVYLFLPEHGEPVWEPAWDDPTARFLRCLNLLPGQLSAFKQPDERYTMVPPGVSLKRARQRLQQRGLSSRGYQSCVLAHLPVHRLRYRFNDHRQLALAQGSSLFLDSPPSSHAGTVHRQRLFYGAATAGVILGVTVLLGGWAAALLCLALGLTGTTLLARQIKRG